MTPPANAALVVTTTHDAEDKARALAAAVVGERLAACAQVYPIRSVYRWEGEVQDAAEWRTDFKTRADLGDRLTAYIRAHHDYDTPEVIAVPVVAGSDAYLGWVAAETAESAEAAED
ncbi:divalent-cation tolerance protein CutA [Kitasatospora sp. NPDC049285]|uniref:divalent-cation tolerance protein CutA n=1 Tax=Kitasatospora sp. NPDC049285 TaxID=3157096 RepID=UPI003417FBDF